MQLIAGPDGGRLELIVDGIFERWIELYAHQPGTRILNSCLPEDATDLDHQVQLRVSKRRHPSSSGHACRLTGVVVEGRVRPPRQQRSGAPDALPPLAHPRQLNWQEHELGLLVRPGPPSPGVATGPGWGDCEQWAQIARVAGLGGLVLEVLPQDGRALWNAAGDPPDVVSRITAACRAQGLACGLQFSMGAGAQPIAALALRDLEGVLEKSAELYAVRFVDTQPNGDGRGLDWPLIVNTVRRLQPHAAIFNHAGPDVRSIGVATGHAPAVLWNMLRRDEFEVASARFRDLDRGQQDGTHWLPGECVVDLGASTAAQLFHHWESTVGRGASLLLRVAPQADGRLDPGVLKRLRGFVDLRAATYGADFARGAKMEVERLSNRLNHLGPILLVDGDRDTYWCPPSMPETGGVATEIELPEARTFDRVLLSEFVELGQAVSAFHVDVRVGEEWRELVRGATIGRELILPIEATTARTLRLVIDATRGSARRPMISTFGLHNSGMRQALQLFRAPTSGLKLECFTVAIKNPRALQRALPVSAVVVRGLGSEAPKGEWNALVYKGFVQVPADGMYKLAATLQEGLRVLVAGEVLIDTTQALDAPGRRGLISLHAGHHKLRVERFGGTVLAPFELRWSRTDEAGGALSEEMLFH